MFIATALANQSKLCRSEITSATTLRTYGARNARHPGVYKHFIQPD